MDSQLTADGAALRLFFTDDIYLVNEPDKQVDAPDTNVNHNIPEQVSEVQIESVKEQIAFKFLGNNKRNILILVNDEHNEVSDEMGRELLRKIVKSVNLTANDFALLNYAGYNGVGFRQLMDHFSSTLVFAFGVTPAELGLPLHAEHVIVSEGSVKLIFSAELKKLDQNPAGKKALWGSLQNLGL